MSVFSEIDMIISDSIVSGDSSSKIVDTLIRDYNVDMSFAQKMVENYFDDMQNDYESKFEIEYD